MGKSNRNPEIAFPLTVRYPDGICDEFEAIHDLELDLEFFDPHKEPGCEVRDAYGRLVRLVVDKLQLIELEFADEAG